MRFDLIANFSPGETKPWPRVLEMINEQCSLAEQAGFTTAWFTEHHFAHNGYMNAPPNPIQMATHVAAHCKNLRVGTAPIVLPDWHPIRVAEDVAMLDNMTLGRVDFGVAKGINERSTIQFNTNADRRNNDQVMRLYQENLEIILKAWTNEVFTHKGEFWEFPVPGWQEKNRFFEPLDPKYHDENGEYKAMYIHPRPYTDKHPPVWLMSNAPPTFKLAGEKGWGVISMSAGPKATLACWETYRDSLAKSLNREVELGEGVGVCTSFYVGETMQEAIDTIRPAINAYYEFLGGSRPAGEWTKRGYLDIGEEMTPEDDAMDWFDFLNKRGIIVVGDAEYVVDRFSEKQESIGLDHLMLMQQYTGVSYEKILASWKRLFENVVPRFGTQSIAQKREAINA
ncbi:LLM class flavin-dependent oxidoreductase [Amylibacter sp.]|jgi:alkanesulfonate monooxygenase SsuD/methylene tetrahydromethanopterin reductase-like flavin-dependent oxidoreductase (luciferase family)|nr:LLM class flavin-dependent oxidoreductase [Amylibacter sp.]MDA8913929.1 LLM class flavin-dependent oxidoreductase [Amylibacter sp.]MDA9290691.1 LLM class flavin-dependent oxidoreductase [Amylibacter sp.]MDB3878353.1 LLM class flavin-dependent oxidoreductase [Amylibacter sp.]MDB4125219.1 LLM class flavin-dependent oxidoreductase [Amylibacter sp.]|tara:strand:- start:113 stop:1303 length:1191 start_codon:yes stop_codon:yes gene_type:complete